MVREAMSSMVRQMRTVSIVRGALVGVHVELCKAVESLERSEHYDVYAGEDVFVGTMAATNEILLGSVVGQKVSLVRLSIEEATLLCRQITCAFACDVPDDVEISFEVW